MTDVTGRARDMETATEDSAVKPRIKLIGVGGFGRKVMDAIGVRSQVDLVAVDTGFPFGGASSGITPMVIEMNRTEATGAPDSAFTITGDAKARLESLFDETDFLILVSGMGGRTGTTACAIIAECAKQRGIPVAAFVTEPFAFEGARRRQLAGQGIAALSTMSLLFVLPNERLSQLSEKPLTAGEASKLCPTLTSNAVISLTEMALGHTVIASKFDDVCSLFKRGGTGVVGSGLGSGDLKIDLAMSEALGQLPLNHPGLRQAQGFMVMLTAGTELLLSQLNIAMRWIENIAPADALVVSGARVDLALKDDVRATVMVVGVLGSDQGRPKDIGL